MVYIFYRFIWIYYLLLNLKVLYLPANISICIRIKINKYKVKSVTNKCKNKAAYNEKSPKSVYI